MNLVSISNAHHPQPQSRRGVLTLRCKVFGPGKEDWNRGLREPRRIVIREARLSRCADGTIRLHGFLGLNLTLDASSLARIRQQGLKIASSDLEIEIDALAFAQALASLPRSGVVVPFSRRSSR